MEYALPALGIALLAFVLARHRALRWLTRGDLDGRLLTDRKGHWHRHNTRLQRLMGADAELPVSPGSPPPAWFLDQLADPDDFAERSAELLDSRHERRWQTLLADGRTCEVTSRPVGRLRLWIFRDVTDLARAQSNLQAAKEAAEAASQAKGDFLAVMSHEIRTPLNGLVGMASLLGQTAVDAEQRGYVDGLQRSASALLGLVDDVLDVARIESGKLVISPARLDLRALVEDVVVAQAQRHGDRPVELLIDFPLEVPHRLVGDPKRLRQVLTNLFDNAIKFTAEGHVALRVRRDTTLDGPKAIGLTIIVEDTGKGISPDVLPRLFQPFSQGDASLSRSHGGSGLGLVICHELVSLMGGKIEVASRENVGTTFTVRLSLPVDLTTLSDSERLDPRPLRGARMLLLDAYEPSRHLLVQRLSELGVEVEEFGELEAAAARAGEEGAPEVLLVSDGPGLALELAERAPLESRLVMLASLERRAQRAAAREAGFAAILDLPLTSVALRSGLLQVHLAGPSRRVPTAPMERQHSTTELPLQQPDPSAPRARVLVVEDDAINAEVAKSWLTRLGCQVDHAPDGAEALKRLGVLRFDLVLMDCQMPVMDGLEATRAIRRTIGEDLPVVAMTAQALSGDRERCLAAGMNDYLSKPVTPEQLEEMLQRWVDEQPSPVPLEVERSADRRRGTASRRMRRAIAGVRTLAEVEASVLAGLGQGEDGKAFLDQLLTAFMTETEGTLRSLRLAIGAGDREEVGRLAHTLKGRCANVGAVGMRDRAVAMQRLPEGDWQEGAVGLMEELTTGLPASVAGLREALL